MTEAARAGLRQALAISGTALAVGSLHVPQPFLAVLAAQLVGGIACRDGWDLARRLAGAWGGAATGMALLAAAPQQPWISLPAFGLAAGFGIPAVSRALGASPMVLFAMGLGGMFSAGIVYPAQGLAFGMAHVASLSVAATVSAGAWWLCMGNAHPTSPLPPLPLPATLGLSASGSLVLACLTLPSEGVVMTIATMTTVCAMQASGKRPGIGARFLGALGAVLLSAIFIVLVSGSGNNLAVFLVALAIVMGGLEWVACASADRALACRQAAALFAVAATTLPQPETVLTASLGRMAAVLLGFCVAVPFFLVAEVRARQLPA